MIAAEAWRPVIGFPRYEVSNCGRVRRSSPGPGTFVGKILLPQRDRDGYLTVSPVRNGKNVTCKVHQLVAEAFIGPCPERHEVNHKDTNKDNCADWNLEYVTHVENMQHSHQNGRVPKGDGHANSKLTEEKVRAIRNERPTTQKEFERIGARLGVSPATVRDAATGRRWKHVT